MCERTPNRLDAIVVAGVCAAAAASSPRIFCSRSLCRICLSPARGVAVLCCSMLFYGVLCCSMLFYAVLCCSMLFSSVAFICCLHVLLTSGVSICAFHMMFHMVFHMLFHKLLHMLFHMHAVTYAVSYAPSYAV